MPAAAVIPAPIAYINVVAVKKLVVGFQYGLAGLPMGMHWLSRVSSRRPRLLLTETGGGNGTFTLRKSECSKQANWFLYVLAWDNEIGLWCYFVGFEHRSND